MFDTTCLTVSTCRRLSNLQIYWINYYRWNFNSFVTSKWCKWSMKLTWSDESLTKIKKFSPGWWKLGPNISLKRLHIGKLRVAGLGVWLQLCKIGWVANLAIAKGIQICFHALIFRFLIYLEAVPPSCQYINDRYFFPQNRVIYKQLEDEGMCTALRWRVSWLPMDLYDYDQPTSWKTLNSPRSIASKIEHEITWGLLRSDSEIYFEKYSDLRYLPHELNLQVYERTCNKFLEPSPHLHRQCHDLAVEDPYIPNVGITGCPLFHTTPKNLEGKKTKDGLTLEEIERRRRRTPTIQATMVSIYQQWFHTLDAMARKITWDRSNSAKSW